MDTNPTRRRTPTRRLTRRIALLALACGLLAAFVLSGTALGARGLTTGFQSDYYQSTDAGTRDFWLKKTVDADAGIIRINVPWLTYGGPTKPANPADPNTYNTAPNDLSDIDNAVRDAKAHGLDVMLVPNGAPPWAEGPAKPADAVAGSWRPNPADYADFVKALALRYSGSFQPPGQPPLPAVKAIEVWNEPNTSGSLTPQFEGKTDVVAGIYRDLLNAAYDAIKGANPSIQVITGGTAPYGDNPGGPYPPGIQRVRPVTFWEDVLCVQPVKSKKPKKKGAKPAKTKYVRKGGCNGPVKFDALAHHPIDNTGGGPLKHGPNVDDASTPDLGRITSVLRGAEKAGTTQGGKHPVWVTEFWWDSKPPNPSGANLITQARWIEQSLYLFWKAGASTAINFVVGDTSVRPNVHAGFQGGVYFQDGRPKPSLTAYQFPFVTSRINRTTLEAWGKAPEAGKVLIQAKQGGWKTIKRLSVGKGSTFVTKLKLPGKQLLRAKLGARTSVTWKQAAFGTKASSSGGGLSGWQIVLIAVAALALLLVVAGVLRRRQVVRRRQSASPRRTRDGFRSVTAH